MSRIDTLINEVSSGKIISLIEAMNVLVNDGTGNLYNFIEACKKLGHTPRECYAMLNSDWDKLDSFNITKPDGTTVDVLPTVKQYQNLKRGDNFRLIVELMYRYGYI